MQHPCRWSAYYGHSLIVSPWGEILAEATTDDSNADAGANDDIILAISIWRVSKRHAMPFAYITGHIRDNLSSVQPSTVVSSWCYHLSQGTFARGQQTGAVHSGQFLKLSKAGIAKAGDSGSLISMRSASGSSTMASITPRSFIWDEVIRNASAASLA